MNRTITHSLCLSPSVTDESWPLLVIKLYLIIFVLSLSLSLSRSLSTSGRSFASVSGPRKTS